MPSTNAEITFNFGSFPEGVDFADWNDFLQEFSKLITGYLPGNYTAWNYGDSTPAAEDQDKPWLRTITGAPDGVYVYYGGKWVRKHPCPASGNERRIWVGTESNLWSYDGGDGNDPSTTAPTATTGAMWEKDDNFDAKFLCGAGAFENAGTLSVAGSTTDTGTSGVDQLTWNEDALPEHSHRMTFPQAEGTEADPLAARFLYTPSTVATGTAGEGGSGQDPNTFPQVGIDTSDVGTATEHNNLPPMYGIYVIKRTARVYYTVT